MVADLTQLSRTISHALRHEPWVYELELDPEGWTDVAALVAALRQESNAWRELEEADIVTMMRQASKQRFEMLGGRIRAMYGHSLPGKLLRSPAAPPSVLYHGTSPQTEPLIRCSGLLPMARQYVHLSMDVETAISVGRRKDANPVVLTVHASEAARSGVAFYLGNDKVWLADRVPPEFIA